MLFVDIVVKFDKYVYNCFVVLYIDFDVDCFVVCDDVWYFDCGVCIKFLV